MMQSVEKKWLELMKKRVRMDGIVLELMRNPDTTAEELMKIHEVYTDTYKTMRAVEHKVESVLRNPPDNIARVIKS